MIFLLKVPNISYNPFSYDSNIFQFVFFISAKEMKYRTWKFAISKCIAWQGIQHDSSFKDFVYEDKGKVKENTQK